MLDGSNHGIYKVVPPTLSDGAVSTLQVDKNGNLRVVIMGLITIIANGLNINPRIVTASGDVAIDSSDYAVVINKTANEATTVNLPPNVLGEAFIIKDGKGDGATNNITVVPSVGTIDGNGNYIIKTNYGAISFFGDGTNWLIISEM